MPNTRFTIEMLKTMSDRDILITILNDRINDLNPYGPLAKRLSVIVRNLSQEVTE